MMTIVFTLAFNWAVLLPLLARRTFGGSAATFGIMSALTGVGAFVAAIVMANRASSPIAPPSMRRLSAFAVGSGLALLFPAVAPNLGLAYVTMVPLGLTVMVFIITANSMLQLRSKPALRGRVMALYGMVFLGSTPVGSVLTGWMAQRWGPRVGFVMGGAAAIAAGLGGLWWRARASTPAAVPIGEGAVGEGLVDGLPA
jgi:MFS family permease